MINLSPSYYRLLKDLQKKPTPELQSEELVTSVYLSEWVKIFLIGNITTKQISIQVEVAYSGLVRHDREGKPTLEDIAVENDVKYILKTQILHLNYLLRLHEVGGFHLGVIREENIWFATKDLDDEPTEEMQNNIIPPSI